MRLQKRSLSAIKRLLMLLIVVSVYGIWQYFSIQRFGAEIQPKQSDTIIILGAQVWGDEPSPSLRERCDWAYELYQKGYAPKLILSGAHGAGNISEAEAMRKYLERKGVPRDAMLLKDALLKE